MQFHYENTFFATSYIQSVPVSGRLMKCHNNHLIFQLYYIIFQFHIVNYKGFKLGREKSTGIKYVYSVLAEAP